ncbi:RNA 2'-phosphotransferase [Massilia sp. Se16.2.3]|uniref:RNA 2'-phosphotransferase n=1 Tax=Massilia sp. Se16.2.3 TaxID=2709303 RepID=UPI001603712C|nr:RNA 2'-phosphotransferase [Massilia sp. Se16.2.3]QNA99488.1 RNA 2'-phosphotransferase [Massilia sp. Se16.2.3]
MSKHAVETSKFLSFVLRHAPQAIGIALDSEGWVEVSTLIEAAGRHGRSIDRALVDEVVRSNDKKRFAVSDDGLRIRAVQGHSTTSVQLRHRESVPPPQLYHGTATRFLDAIREEGLRPGSRHHVHLSPDHATAVEVGARHGKPVVLRVDAATMHADGLRFYQADNGVWLTESVPPGYLDVPGRS